ncbi:MAG: (d)CMP kinase [Armatimonadetes bacterium]|jgi:cytidylate kinase|nr:(d)CMP kinase [Armatimonadota bacterium]MCA1997554.1 (d)CMP kinase [Armatimonadota bacterium]
MPNGRRLMVVAIDGPAGAGKSTVARLLAKRLGLRYLDTGAMYRCVALRLREEGGGAGDREQAEGVARAVRIEFQAGEPQRVFCDGRDVTEAIRLPEIGDLASAVSAIPGVRRALVERQREIVGAGGIVLEGRDAGTVIAPNAELKVFLTASDEERARRRCRELEQRGIPADFQDVLARLRERDLQDQTREDSPLRMAEDAVLLETDGMGIEEVVDRLARLAEERAKA